MTRRIADKSSCRTEDIAAEIRSVRGWAGSETGTESTFKVGGFAKRDAGPAERRHHRGRLRPDGRRDFTVACGVRRCRSGPLRSWRSRGKGSTTWCLGRRLRGGRGGADGARGCRAGASAADARRGGAIAVAPGDHPRERRSGDLAVDLGCSARRSRTARGTSPSSRPRSTARMCSARLDLRLRQEPALATRAGMEQRTDAPVSIARS